ncbi:MAG: tetratricopeptide repeat protein, partial [Gemmatimonadaceae bacterium]
PALRRPSEVPRPLTRDSTALALYRAGRYLLRQSYQDSDAATRRKSIEMLRQAVARDSGFAHAYILLAEAIRESDGLDENGDGSRRLDYIRRAIALDSTIAEAHSLLAGILLERNYDVRGAAAEHRKAMSLNPSSVDVLWEFSLFLRVVGRPGEALKHLRRAKALEPENAFVRGGILQTLRGLEDTTQLRREIDEAMMLLPNFVGVRHHLAHLELKRGRPDSALAILDGLPPTLGNLWLYAQAGRPEPARRRLDSLTALSNNQRLSPITLAVLHSSLDNRREALDYLWRAHEQGLALAEYLSDLPFFDSVKSDPRFIELRRRRGLTALGAR